MGGPIGTVNVASNSDFLLPESPFSESPLLEEPKHLGGRMTLPAKLEVQGGSRFHH